MLWKNISNETIGDKHDDMGNGVSPMNSQNQIEAKAYKNIMKSEISANFM